MRAIVTVAAGAFSAASFAGAVTFTKTHYTARAAPRAAAVADFSLNGTLDLAVASSGDNSVWWREGLQGSGLCQIVITVPDVAAGDLALVAEVGGAISPETARITIQP